MTSLRHVAEVKEEESEKEDEPLPKSVKKTPRRSTKEDSGAFSDYNPFQSGSEAAAERDRRRRKVSIYSPNMSVTFADMTVVDRIESEQTSSAPIL